MTVGSSLSKAGPFIADGVQKEFPYEFSLLDPTHIAVWVDGSRILKGFIVTQNSVVFTEAPADGSRVTLIRDVPFTQETDIQNNTAFFPEVIEKALDKLTMISQQLEEKSERSLTLPPGEGEADLQRVFERVGVAETAAVSAEASAASAVAAAAQTQKDSASVKEVLEKSAGIPIGAIFPFPASVPPEGAYLLNGQTIAGCNELYPKFWAWVNTAGVRIVDNATFEAELAKYGFCSGFVIDSAAGSVRLPKWRYQAPLGDTLPVRGNGIAVGFTNGSANGGLFSTNTSSLGFYSSADLLGDAVTNSIPAISNPVNGILGLVEDPAVSGIVAENNAPEDHFVCCIQVYNAATALSEQESAQLASLMQTKAQTDLANVNGNIDYVVESWNDGAGGWYRKYRSGWVEQGGVIPQPSAVRTATVNFWIEMLDTNYKPNVTQTSDTSGGATFAPREVSCFKLTETTMDVRNFETSDQGTRWEVKGYAATE